MTHKEIAERLRDIKDAPALTIEGRDALKQIADDLDPPRPEPGHVWVWYSGRDKPVAGIRDENGIVHAVGGMLRSVERVELARSLAPDEVAVKVPPVSEWPDNAEYAQLTWCFWSGVQAGGRTRWVDETGKGKTITRAEAERMEVEDE